VNDPALTIANDVLQEMYRTSRARTADGAWVTLDSVVTPEFANALYELVRREAPEVVLEIGMAHGATALSIATALAENGSGRLISVDPFQRTEWRGVGVTAIEKAGLTHLHELIEEPDYFALPHLLERLEGGVDLAYIDGLHSREYVLLDFFYVDRLLRTDGIVGFNDCDWPSVIPTLRFLRRHRKYERVDVGLPPRYGTRNGLIRSVYRAEAHFLPPRVRPSELRPIARLMGRRRDDAYFRKLATWEPPEGWMPRGWTLGR
jgi:predicted O-methyltransferase YrrM